MSYTELDPTNVTTNATEHENPVSESYLGTAGVFITICIIGTLFNFAGIVLILRDLRTLLTPINVVLLNLVIGDFSVAVFGTPLVIASSLMGKWPWGHSGCLWYAWFMSTFGMVSIGNLTVLAVERWVLVTRPMKAFTIRQSSFMVLGIWIFALTLTIPPLVGWGRYGPEAANLSCSVSWEVHDPETHSGSYIGFLFVFGLVVPVFLIVYSYVNILLTLRRVKERVGSRRSHEARVTKMVATMIVAFIVAWAPYATFALAAQYFWLQAPPLLAIAPSILAKSSICYNPIIYIGMNSQFQGVISKRFGFMANRFGRTSAVSEPTGVSGANRNIVKQLQIEDDQRPC